MDLEQVKKDVETGKALLIDVREQEEWDEGHLPLARHIPLSQIERGVIPDDIPQGKTVYLHCRRGRRAERAAALLKERFPHAIALKYSYEELKNTLS